NMSGFVCPRCGAESQIFSVGGGERISKDLGVPFIGSIPLDPRICEASDRGKPFIIEYPDSPAAKAFMKVVDVIESSLEQRPN
ncbi:MAG: P-loop NTPase, partial [Candidatus Bathyarchaeia archaeon]